MNHFSGSSVLSCIVIGVVWLCNGTHLNVVLSLDLGSVIGHRGVWFVVWFVSCEG